MLLLGLGSNLSSSFGDRFENLDLAAKLKNGILDLHRATGRLFGGDLKLNSKVNALPRENRYQAKFSLKRLDMPLALRSFGDKTLKSGIMEVIGNLRTGGSNVADMISRMNGSGSLSLSGVDVSSGSGQGSFFSGFCHFYPEVVSYPPQGLLQILLTVLE